MLSHPRDVTELILHAAQTSSETLATTTETAIDYRIEAIRKCGVAPERQMLIGQLSLVAMRPPVSERRVGLAPALSSIPTVIRRSPRLP
jgi:hypothetical protein